MDETGIVYCMTKKEAESLSDFLRDNGVKADYYHAGQTLPIRKLVQGAWLRGDIKVVCATIAYGMGIDKKDVRYVLHMSLAKSLEGYYQVTGALITFRKMVFVSDSIHSFIRKQGERAVITTIANVLYITGEVMSVH